MNKIVYFVAGICILWGCTAESEYLETLVQVTPDEKIVQANTNHNIWIYKQMNDHYYWRKEMPDTSSLNFAADPPVFFKSLLSKQDRFSWCELNSNYTGSTEQIYLPDKIGFEYQSYRDSRNQLIHQVLYVTHNNAQQAGIERGNWVRPLNQSAEQCRLEKGSIRNGCFVPSTQATVNLLASTTTSVNNTLYLDSVYTIGSKKIGYMVYLQYEEKSDLFPAFNLFRQKGVDELILDLRYNPGGYVSTAAFLCGLIVNQSALGKVFQTQEYNDIQGQINQKETGNSVLTEKIPSSSLVVQNNLNLDKVYVLTTSNSASASEATIVGLTPYMQVIIVGQNTYGKGVGSYTLQDKQYKYQLQPITFRYFNARHETVPDTGLIPNYKVEEDIQSGNKLGDISEPLLHAALSVISGTTATRASGLETTIQTTPLPGLKKAGEASFVHKFNSIKTTLK